MKRILMQSVNFGFDIFVYVAFYQILIHNDLTLETVLRILLVVFSVMRFMNLILSDDDIQNLHSKTKYSTFEEYYHYVTDIGIIILCFITAWTQDYVRITEDLISIKVSWSFTGFLVGYSWYLLERKIVKVGAS